MKHVWQLCFIFIMERKVVFTCLWCTFGVPCSSFISDFNEGFHVFGLHITICDFLGGDCFIVTDTFWYIWTVFFLSSPINALLCHYYVDASIPLQYLYVWYINRNVVRISVTCPYTAWYFFSLMWNMWKLPAVKPTSHWHPDVTNFDVLLTLRLSKFILVINQLDAQNFVLQ